MRQKSAVCLIGITLGVRKVCKKLGENLLSICMCHVNTVWLILFLKLVESVHFILTYPVQPIRHLQYDHLYCSQ